MISEDSIRLANGMRTFQRKTLLNTTKYPWKEAISQIYDIPVEKLKLVAFNPWRGCKHNCSYCFVKSLIKRNKYIKPDGVFDNVELCSNVLERLAVELPKLDEHTVIIASTLTDIFQPDLFDSPVLYRLFKEWLKALQNYKVLFITKNAAVMRFYDLFNKEKHTIGFTLSGLNKTDKTKKHYEPGSSNHLARVVAATRALDKGFKLFVSFEPYFKSLTELLNQLIGSILRNSVDDSKINNCFITMGTCNYSLSNLWTKKEYLRFYAETMAMKYSLNLNLWWKPDALEKLEKWRGMKSVR